MGKKIKVGIVGLGRIGHVVHIMDLLAYPELFELVAAADILPERLKDTEKKVPGIKTYNSLDEMLKNPDLDMITIATRHPDHVPMALKVLEAGKIALVEKPIATSLAEMDLLIAAGKAHPGKLFLRHNRRFEPAFMKVQQMIKDGLVGEVQYIKSHRSVGYCRRNDWMTMTDYYGGLLTNWGPHLLDQALQFLGAPVVDMWADVRNVISIGDGDDLFKIMLKGSNGRVADVEVAGCNAMPGREIEIIGSRGTIVYEGGPTISVRRVDPSVILRDDLKPHPETPPRKYGNLDEKLYFVEEKHQVPDQPRCPLWQYLYDCVMEGKEYPITFEQAREVVRITEEAFRRSSFAPIQKYHAKTTSK